MLPLPELQARFAATLRADPDAPVDAALLASIGQAGLDPAVRLGVYRGNLRGNFLKVLGLEFPAIRRLGGTEWFEQAGLEFLREHPSRSGDLHAIGLPFAGWLAQRLQQTPFAWFTDVARLEWAWQECLVAADSADRLDVAALAGIPAEVVAELRFTMHPALRLVQSRWPVFSIWEANRDAEDEPAEGGPANNALSRARAATLDLDAGGQCVWIRRSADGAEARRCDEATFEWLAVLADGATLGSAWEAACQVEPQFDVARALATAVALDLFAGFQDRA